MPSTRRLLLACILLVAPIAFPASARADDGQDAVRVFILAGQSNMVGAGQVVANPKRNDGRGSLEWCVRNPDTAGRFKHLVDDEQGWVERDDVKIWYLGRTGGLKPGFGADESKIGPELGFGCVVGEAFEEPVLLIKIAWGGKSLAADFRPPSSGGETGPYYDTLVETVQTVMKEAGDHFPELAGRRLLLSGLGWHQGWNDRINQTFNDAYAENLANFIRDMRKSLDAPGLPVVIAETGMSGPDEKHPRALSLMAAQASVAELVEFKNDVAFVGTRAFYRSPEQSPSGQQYHWNSNAETYYLIGEAMGLAMVDLLRRE